MTCSLDLLTESHTFKEDYAFPHYTFNEQGVYQYDLLLCFA